jgi:ABC-type transport system involved in cytochrome bd biosynthesis fused ATPase/permease subunit
MKVSFNLFLFSFSRIQSIHLLTATSALDAESEKLVQQALQVLEKKQ